MTDIVERLREGTEYGNLTAVGEQCLEAADEIERNRAAIDELVEAIECLCNKIDYEGASPLDWPSYDEALAAANKHKTTTKEQ